MISPLTLPHETGFMGTPDRAGKMKYILPKLLSPHN